MIRPRSRIAEPEAPVEMPGISVDEMPDWDAVVPCTIAGEPCERPAVWHARITRCRAALPHSWETACQRHHDALLAYIRDPATHLHCIDHDACVVSVPPVQWRPL